MSKYDNRPNKTESNPIYGNKQGTHVPNKEYHQVNKYTRYQ